MSQIAYIRGYELSGKGRVRYIMNRSPNPRRETVIRKVNYMLSAFRKDFGKVRLQRIAFLSK